MLLGHNMPGGLWHDCVVLQYVRGFTPLWGLHKSLLISNKPFNFCADADNVQDQRISKKRNFYRASPLQCAVRNIGAFSGALNMQWLEKCRFATEITVYLGNGMRGPYGKSQSRLIRVGCSVPMTLGTLKGWTRWVHFFLRIFVVCKYAHNSWSNITKLGMITYDLLNLCCVTLFLCPSVCLSSGDCCQNKLGYFALGGFGAVQNSSIKNGEVVFYVNIVE